MAAGDRLLICSDGLSDELDDEAIATVLAAGYTAQRTAELLVAASLEGGGHDNTTAVVVDALQVPDLPPTAHTSRPGWREQSGGAVTISPVPSPSLPRERVPLPEGLTRLSDGALRVDGVDRTAVINPVAGSQAGGVPVETGPQVLQALGGTYLPTVGPAAPAAPAALSAPPPGRALAEHSAAALGPAVHGPGAQRDRPGRAQ